MEESDSQPPRQQWTRTELALVVIAIALVAAIALAGYIVLKGSPTADVGPTPTATPLPSAGGASGSYAEFEAHVHRAAADLRVILTGMQAWLPNVLNSTLAAEKVGEYQDQWNAWAKAELVWMDAHPPDSCYQAAFDAWHAYSVEASNATVFGTGSEQATLLLSRADAEMGIVGCP